MVQAGSIQDAVATALAEMGIATDSLVHTILLRGGYFVGHKFRFDGGYAVWLAEKNLAEFYDDGGKLLKTVTFESDEKEAA